MEPYLFMFILFVAPVTVLISFNRCLRDLKAQDIYHLPLCRKKCADFSFKILFLRISYSSLRGTLEEHLAHICIKNKNSDFKKCVFYISKQFFSWATRIKL